MLGHTIVEYKEDVRVALLLCGVEVCIQKGCGWMERVTEREREKRGERELRK